MIVAKTVTIAQLMEIAPVGTVDPTPSLYKTTIYAMAGLLLIALIADFPVKLAQRGTLCDGMTNR